MYDNDCEPPLKEEAMKVRHKESRPDGNWIVVEESPNYYIAYPEGCTPTAVTSISKKHYEPVQEWARKYYVPFPLENVRMKAEGSITVIEVKK